jgi:NDP-sugar pyrophosphorylase family protein
MKGLEIVVMCGGLGTRLAGAIPPSLPKCLAPIAGETTFLDILIEGLRRERPDRITLATGHLGATVRKHMVVYDGIECVEDTERGGTAQCALHHLKLANTNNLVVVNGDTWQENFDLELIMSRHRAATQTPITASVTSEGLPRGIFVLSKQFVFRTLNHEAVFQGQNLDAKFLFRVQRHMGPVNFHFKDGPFYDIGTPKDLEDFRSYWKSRGVLRLSPAHPTESASSAEGPTTRPTTSSTEGQSSQPR